MKPWTQVSLGELLRLERRPVKVEADKQYQEIGIYCFGRGVFHKLPRSGLEVGDKDLFLMKEGDFILQVTFAWEGAIAIIAAAEDGMYGSTRYPTFRVDETRCDSRFLLNYFKTEGGRKQIANICPGSAGRNRVLSMKRIPEIMIPLPPLVEQRRIVARIEHLAVHIHQARALRQQALEESDALIASRVSHLFSEGVEHGWKTCTLGDYVASDCYGTSEKTTDDSSGIPVLRMGNIQNGRLDFRNLRYLHLSDEESEKLNLIRGDILVNRTNSAELVGKCAVFESDERFSFASYLIRLRLDTARAHPRLVAAYINSPLGRAYMLTEKKQMTGQANVNSTKLKALPFALPPLAEQRHIVAELDALQAEVDALQREQAVSAAELDALLPAILDRAFKGGL